MRSPRRSAWRSIIILRAVEILRARLAETGGIMNEARMRMTRMPAGAELVLNKISAAPGFRIDNVIVMAGIPQVMQAMLDYVAPQLKTGVKMLSDTVRADCREGDIGTELGAVAKAHPDVIIGSYPFIDENRARQRPRRDALARPAKARRRQGRGRGDAQARAGAACGQVGRQNGCAPVSARLKSP